MSTGKWKKPTGIQCTTRWQERQLRKASPKDRMLHDFLGSPTPQTKRAIIASFNPYYFIFGNTLDPRNPYEKENQDEPVSISI